ncbi:response regulator FixJ [soil metagenome]
MLKSIYIVDDDDAVRGSLHAMLSTQQNMLVRSFRTGDRWLENLDDLEPGVLLLDYNMPGSSGIEVLETLKAKAIRKFATILVTGEGNIALAVQAMQAGALDFIEKPYDANVMLARIELAFARLNEEIAAVAHVEQAREKINALSPREQEVLRGLIDGNANKIIAHDLAISPRTVEIYRANVMTKLNVRSLPEAMRIAFAAGMIALT